MPIATHVCRHDLIMALVELRAAAATSPMTEKPWKLEQGVETDALRL